MKLMHYGERNGRRTLCGIRAPWPAHRTNQTLRVTCTRCLAAMCGMAKARKLLREDEGSRLWRNWDLANATTRHFTPYPGLVWSASHAEGQA